MSHLQLLDWDSRHFGIPVAQITRPDLDDASVEEALAGARRDGIRLLYWAAPPRRVLPDAVLQKYVGKLVDRKVVFERALPRIEACHATPNGMRIVAYPKGPPSDALLALGVAAGQYSRFKVDQRIPPDKFRGLYETWIEGSTSGRLADEVLVACASGDGTPVGMITLAKKGSAGNIGLIAVSEVVRGRGVGLWLLKQGHGWMTAKGLSTVTVVTQCDNLPACKLYERGGYRVKSVHDVYHFWPSVPRPDFSVEIPIGTCGAGLP